jgi:hypothetical protein
MEPIKFKDMTPEQRSEIVEALVADPASVESYQPDGVWLGKRNSSTRFVHMSSCYRIKPRRLVIPWDILRSDIVAVAMDADGWVHAYTTVPTPDHGAWSSMRADACSLRCLNINTTGVNWRESLVMRPRYGIAVKGE